MEQRERKRKERKKKGIRWGQRQRKKNEKTEIIKAVWGP